MKRLVVVGLSAVVATSLAACSPQQNVSTGGSNNVQAQSAQTQTQQTDQHVKKFKPNFSQDFKYIKLNVSEISISPDEVDVGMNYQNTSGQKLDWFPDQAHLTIGDMQLDADPLTQTSLVSGEIAVGTKSDGILAFKPPAGKKIDVNKVNDLKFDFDTVTPSDFSGDAQKVQFDIPVK